MNEIEALKGQASKIYEEIQKLDKHLDYCKSLIAKAATFQYMENVYRNLSFKDREKTEAEQKQKTVAQAKTELEKILKYKIKI